MESREESTLRLLNEILYPRLEAEPFEFARDEFVARHHGVDFSLPVGTDEGATAGFDRPESVLGRGGNCGFDCRGEWGRAWIGLKCGKIYRECAKVA
jgi:hypothetical protein